LLSAERHWESREASGEASYGRSLSNFYRDYDPSTGRYLEADPIGLHGGINPFAYVDNNPVAEVDPLGLIAVGRRVSFLGVLPPLQSIIGFGDAFGAAWFRDEGLDQFVDECSPEYIWGQRIGFLWSLGPFALRGLAAAGATRWGHFLNHNRYLRFGPGRMPRAGPGLPSGTGVPRASFGPQTPLRPNPHLDLRSRIPYVPPFGGWPSADDCRCQQSP
jgi:RHS repeat-associated protein